MRSRPPQTAQPHQWIPHRLRSRTGRTKRKRRRRRRTMRVVTQSLRWISPRMGTDSRLRPARRVSVRVPLRAGGTLGGICGICPCHKEF